MWIAATAAHLRPPSGSVATLEAHALGQRVEGAERWTREAERIGGFARRLDVRVRQGHCWQTDSAQAQSFAAAPGGALHEMCSDLTIGVSERRATR